MARKQAKEQRTVSFGNRGVTVPDHRPAVPESSRGFTRAPFERWHGVTKPDPTWYAVDSVLDDKLEEITGRDIPKSLVERVGHGTYRLLKSGKISTREVYAAERWLRAYEIAEFDPKDGEPNDKVSASKTSYDGRMVGRIGKADELRAIQAALGMDTHYRLLAFVFLGLSQNKTARWLAEQSGEPKPKDPRDGWERFVAHEYAAACDLYRANPVGDKPVRLASYAPEWATTFRKYDEDLSKWESTIRKDALSRLNRLSYELVSDLCALSEYYHERDNRPRKAA